MAKCTKCGAALRDGAKFCSICGTKIEVRRFCTECGEELGPGDKFCSQCGTPAKGVSAPKAPAAPTKPQETDPSYFEVEDCDGGCRVKRYTGPDEGAVVIPSCIRGKKVVEIGSKGGGYRIGVGNKVFARDMSPTSDDPREMEHYSLFPKIQSLLSSITIPDGVTEIGDEAFAHCKSLTRITIPDSVTEIGDSAFACCESLADITIPDSVTKIGGEAFALCKSLTRITIPNSVTKIEKSSFSSCKELTGITIPDGVTEIGNYAFYQCTFLMSITIPDSLTKIGENAFKDCGRLTIHAHADSAAERYAKENSIPFRLLSPATLTERIRHNTVTYLSDKPTGKYSRELYDEWYRKLDKEDHETLRDLGEDPYDPWR